MISNAAAGHGLGLHHWAILTLAGVLLVLAVGLVRRDYRRGDRLSWVTVGVVWVAYVFHGFGTAWFAWTAPLGRAASSALPWAVVGGFVAGAGATMAAEAIVTFRSFQRMSGRDTSRLVVPFVPVRGAGTAGADRLQPGTRGPAEARPRTPIQTFSGSVVSQ